MKNKRFWNVVLIHYKGWPYKEQIPKGCGNQDFIIVNASMSVWGETDRKIPLFVAASCRTSRETASTAPPNVPKDDRLVLLTRRKDQDEEINEKRKKLCLNTMTALPPTCALWEWFKMVEDRKTATFFIILYVCMHKLSHKVLLY